MSSLSRLFVIPLSLYLGFIYELILLGFGIDLTLFCLGDEFHKVILSLFVDEGAPRRELYIWKFISFETPGSMVLSPPLPYIKISALIWLCTCVENKSTFRPNPALRVCFYVSVCPPATLTKGVCQCMMTSQSYSRGCQNRGEIINRTFPSFPEFQINSKKTNPQN